MSDDDTVVAAEGLAPDGERWALRYAPTGGGGDHHLALLVNGNERQSGSGFDVPRRTEIGFGGGLTPGRGSYYLYGVTTSRIRVIRAECRDNTRESEVPTTAFLGASTEASKAFRAFVLVRPPVEDVLPSSVSTKPGARSNGYASPV